MPTCVVCGWRNTMSASHNILDKFHLRKIAQHRSPTIAAQIIENNYRQVAGEDCK